MPGRLTERQLYAPVDEKFGRLYVLSYAGRAKFNKHYYTCKCDCGAVVDIERSHLLKGKSRSCGCFRDERNRESKMKHGHNLNNCKTPTYRAWAKLKQAFNNPNHKDYPRYGGSGLTLDPSLEDFSFFLEKLGEIPSSRHYLYIERSQPLVTVDCLEWRLRVNYRRYLLVRGEYHTIADCSRIYGVPLKTICQRLRQGWSEERAVVTPVRERIKKSDLQEKVTLRQLLQSSN